MIPAKKTTYKGVTYRSRLEAQWAVFWEEIVSTVSRSYTRVTYQDNHVADFRIEFMAVAEGTKTQTILQEVKPVMPNPESVDHLRDVMSSHKGYAFISLGGFREDSGQFPLIWDWPFQDGVELFQLDVCLERIGLCPPVDCFAACFRARGYRFDL